MSSYKTIRGESEAEIVEKKSRFIAHLAHVETEEEALSFLQRIRDEHSSARHNVYAYALKGGRTRYSDDGEPAQTSGLPTFETLSHSDLLDVVCVTTRYFGGTLLGTGGLVRAYTDACKAAIDVADVVTMSSCADLTITVAYDMYNSVDTALRSSGCEVVGTEFTDSVTVVARCLAEKAKDLETSIVEAAHGRCKIGVSEPFDGVIRD